MKKKESAKRLPRKQKKQQKKQQEKEIFQQLLQQPMMAKSSRRNKDGDATPANGDNSPGRNTPIA